MYINSEVASSPCRGSGASFTRIPVYAAHAVKKQLIWYSLAFPSRSVCSNSIPPILIVRCVSTSPLFGCQKLVDICWLKIDSR